MDMATTIRGYELELKAERKSPATVTWYLSKLRYFWQVWLVLTVGLWWVLTLGQMVIEAATGGSIADYTGWGRVVLT